MSMPTPLRVRLSLTLCNAWSMAVLPMGLKLSSNSNILNSYLLIQQKDEVGLLLFSDNVLQELPPSSTRRQLFKIFELLDSGVVQTGWTSHICGCRYIG